MLIASVDNMIITVYRAPRKVMSIYSLSLLLCGRPNRRITNVARPFVRLSEKKTKKRRKTNRV